MALGDNLDAYWKLDETSGSADDIIGGNDLSNSGGLSYSTGKINNGIYTDGTNVLQSPGVISSNTTNISVSLWVYLSSTNIKGVFFHHGKTTSSHNGYCLGVGSGTLDSTGNELIMLLSEVAWCRFNTNIGAAGWHHIVLTRGATTWKAYIDGTVCGTTWTNNPSTPTGAFRIGMEASTRGFTGRVDEVGFWTRELSSSEVTELYNSGNGLQYPFTGGGGSASPNAIFFGAAF